MRTYSKGSIFIVEDETIIAYDTERMLKKIGYQVSGIAGTADKAEAAIAATEPDIILMDIHLRGNRDGIELADALKKKMDTPIVFVTAHSDRETLDRAKITEPYGYVVKPIDLRELEIIIEISLYKARAERERKQLKKEINTLRRIIPICSSCKKIRDDDGYWKQVEDYFREHSDIDFTHGLCQDCVRKLYPEIAGEIITGLDDKDR